MSLDLPWLAEPWRRAAQALAAGRLPAGLLILGRPGLGRERLATAIAQARLCLQPLPDRHGCAVCASCRQVRAGSHPDFLTVRPEEDKKNIGIDQIRELAGTLALTAGHQGARVALITPADSLTPPAANALLKTLEEPSPGITLILIARSAAGSLPATVISRCLRLPVPTPGGDEALAWLACRAPRDDWPLLLALAADAPLAAERLTEEGIGDAAKPVAQIIASAAGRADPLAVAAQFSDWPLVRLATLIAWLAQRALRDATLDTVPDSGQFGELAQLAARAEVRALVGVWREATILGVEDVSLNAALARERLVLLFVEAFRRPAESGKPQRRATLQPTATNRY